VPPPVPAGIYQASLNQSKFRDMLEILEPPRITTREVRKRLDTRLEKLEVSDVRIDWLVGYLADAAGVEIAVDWHALGLEISRGDKVSLRLANVTVGQALRQAMWVANPRSKLSFQIDPDRVRVTTQDEVGQESVTRVYDVRDLIGRMSRDERAFEMRRVPPAPLPLSPRHGSGLFSYGYGGGGGLDEAETADFADFAVGRLGAFDAMVRYIEERVDPSSWRDNGGTVGDIRLLAGRLVVTQTKANQEDVAVLLEWFDRVFGGRP
jgi:hypothetical protein